jgi:hypothetical protein
MAQVERQSDRELHAAQNQLPGNLTPEQQQHSAVEHLVKREAAFSDRTCRGGPVRRGGLVSTDRAAQAEAGRDAGLEAGIAADRTGRPADPVELALQQRNRARLRRLRLERVQALAAQLHVTRGLPLLDVRCRARVDPTLLQA